MTTNNRFFRMNTRNFGLILARILASYTLFSIISINWATSSIAEAELKSVVEKNMFTFHSAGALPISLGTCCLVLRLGKNNTISQKIYKRASKDGNPE